MRHPRTISASHGDYAARHAATACCVPTRLRARTATPVDCARPTPTTPRSKPCIATISVTKPGSARLTYAAIDGMLETIGDPYTVFWTPAEYRENMETNSGDFVGIGTRFDDMTKEQKNRGHRGAGRLPSGGGRHAGGRHYRRHRRERQSSVGIPIDDADRSHQGTGRLDRQASRSSRGGKDTSISRSSARSSMPASSIFAW